MCVCIQKHDVSLKGPVLGRNGQIPRLLQLRDDLFVRKLPLPVILKGFRHIDEGAIPPDAHILTYTGNTRAYLNAQQHYRVHETEFSPGLRLIFTSNTCKQGAYKLYKNFTYVVSEVTEDELTLYELGAESVIFTLNLGVVRAWFTYAHAKTGHSAQGATYEGAVVVANSNHFYVTREWVWVTLTRGRDLDLVYILDGKERPVDVEAIAGRIRGHEAADLKAGRQVGGLTVGWVLDTHKAQGGLCALCHKPCDLPRCKVKDTLTTASVDRINARGGHQPGNCQLTCRSCNCGKRDALV